MRRARASIIRLLRQANWWENSSFSSSIRLLSGSKNPSMGEGGREADFYSSFVLSEKWNDLESGRAFSFLKVVKIAFVIEKTGAIFFVFLVGNLSFGWISHLDGHFSVFTEIVVNYNEYQLVNENNPLQYSHFWAKPDQRAWKRSKWKNMPFSDPLFLVFAFIKVYVSVV